MVIGRAKEETRQDCHIWGSDLCVDKRDKSKIMAKEGSKLERSYSEVLVLGWGELYNAVDKQLYSVYAV